MGATVSDDLTTAYLLGAEHMRDKLHKQANEIERLKREAEIHLDQIKSEQEAHLRTIADYNRAAVENEKLREALKPFAYNYQDTGLTHSIHMFEMKDLLTAKKVLGCVND